MSLKKLFLIFNFLSEYSALLLSKIFKQLPGRFPDTQVSLFLIQNWGKIPSAKFHMLRLCLIMVPDHHAKFQNTGSIKTNFLIFDWAVSGLEVDCSSLFAYKQKSFIEISPISLYIIKQNFQNVSPALTCRCLIVLLCAQNKGKTSHFHNRVLLKKFHRCYFCMLSSCQIWIHVLWQVDYGQLIRKTHRLTDEQ